MYKSSVILYKMLLLLTSRNRFQAGRFALPAIEEKQVSQLVKSLKNQFFIKKKCHSVAITFNKETFTWKCKVYLFSPQKSTLIRASRVKSKSVNFTCSGPHLAFPIFSIFKLKERCAHINCPRISGRTCSTTNNYPEFQIYFYGRT